MGGDAGDAKDTRDTEVTAGLASLARAQDGVLCRRQVLAAGADDTDVERWLRQRRWARVFAGVYVDHTGPLSWEQRAWAAVLLHRAAALDAGSALRAAGVRDHGSDPGVIELVVPAGSRVSDPAGVRSRRLRDFATSCQLNRSPPRLRLELAALRVASLASDEDAAVAVLGDVVQTGRTTADRLSAALGTLPRTRRRGLMGEVLEDLAVGALSALERRYLRDVERAHGLPRARRQVRHVTGSSVVLRDALYDAEALLVELDGRLGHSTATDRWADLERDLASATAGLLTLRAGWRQVLDPCRLARTVAGVLTERGWPGTVRPCPRCRPAADPGPGEVLRHRVPASLR